MRGYIQKGNYTTVVKDIPSHTTKKIFTLLLLPSLSLPLSLSPLPLLLSLPLSLSVFLCRNRDVISVGSSICPPWGAFSIALITGISRATATETKGLNLIDT